MTAREREVLPLIEAAVPHCRVHAQVAMGALIDCQRGLDSKQRTTVRNRFDRKRIDLLLEEKTSGDVLALVELDDRTHNGRKDRERDELTAAAGYLTIRLPAGKRLDQESVRAQLLAGLAGLRSPAQVSLPQLAKSQTAAL
jgi:very-short-patch-repair endonuclease